MSEREYGSDQLLADLGRARETLDEAHNTHDQVTIGSSVMQGRILQTFDNLRLASTLELERRSQMESDSTHRGLNIAIAVAVGAGIPGCALLSMAGSQYLENFVHNVMRIFEH